MRAPSIVLAGGGTAGHVSPLLAIADALRAARPDADLLAVGTATGMETRLVPAAGYRLATIDRVPLPRSLSADLLRLPTRLARAVRQAGDLLDAAHADAVVGVGGYVCTPLYLAARRRRVPIVIHEANVTAGLANRVGARFAASVGTAFAQTALPHARLVGMPMSRTIADLDRSGARAAARARFGIDPDARLLAVTGGSSGAASLNRALVSALPALAAAGITVLHVTGRGKRAESAPGIPVAGSHYTQIEYVDGMADLYAAADLLVARAGAGTVNEVAAVGLPAVFVPLPHGNGEQALNARFLVDAGAALIVRDHEFTADWIGTHVPELLHDDARLAGMAAAAADLGIRDADRAMARLVLDAAGRHASASPSPSPSARSSIDAHRTPESGPDAASIDDLASGGASGGDGDGGGVTR
ncbi:UDP-N-acetylglucosamine--N-acetylmuramyl-(pentapeptide) pyrophosphoryl-undecaprenol N-acetylglucosamine transferase [Tersicoccus solisilvae]|uniref:UDP-N-acetylglucosamine--N-acetylmuramyl-(pentapeptide) pyrophosphoryl-undecaprenol N-acetylglucosamine transferase n=1 Tax=Tersicoccus solisilvae TaxID=1882339 RepID=A0ABQ1PCH3_9MICC|nr:undecaprenyldiphospho-muramoylpentapeptide beta-N-acetylglucosaminyltransferase [Tersicoccus solisilvae]GGC94545.1 UDP-N-acetylglucosamine--N-acetylmuramyl-(pentapeptide) pyrophosphoryl-undecaprenol N-acetylglucosamine transferase [Tersicoccus solisilvae]